MVQLRTVLFASLSASVALAAPLHKRIDQITSDGPAAWATACTTNGGGSKCNEIKQQAASTLLAAGKNCDQQDAADAMLDLSKTLKNNTDMIRLAQLFVQQPRNAPDKLQVPYCQKAPKNKELNGLFHCQFSGSDFTKFSGDQTGNLPLGVKKVNPPGSCPAKKDGPVPDGVQLNTLVTDPGVGSVGAALAGNATATDPAANATATATAANSTAVDPTATDAPDGSDDPTDDGSADPTDDGDADPTDDGSADPSDDGSADPTDDGSADPSDDGSADPSDDGSVDPTDDGSADPSDDGDADPSDDGSADPSDDGSADPTDDGSADPTDDGSADPTDDGAADPTDDGSADPTDDGSADPTGTAASDPASSAAPADNAAVAAPVAGAKPFTLQNGKDAQALNKKFATLTADSACTTGDDGCINGQFAQCVGGKFAVTGCAGGTKCFALPLVNKAGTSITCSTDTDASSRIANTGATGGITGA